tara:strand:+ start:105 stop:290 length:186 start_codon:yes stop_codon:yes gene_type:complete
MFSLFLFACAAKTIDIGMVDVAEENVCVVQLSDETFAEVESSICASLKEGDVIKVLRIKGN